MAAKKATPRKAAGKKIPSTKTATFNPEIYPYVECREQHHWEFYDGAVDNKNSLGYRVQKCHQCPTKRYTVLDLRPGYGGEVVSRSYKYPGDYQVHGGLDRHDLGALRLHNFLAELSTKDGQSGQQ